MKAKREGFVTTHREAFCWELGCEWHYGFEVGLSIEAITRRAKAHTEKTGHQTMIESRNQVNYVAD